MTGLEAIRLSFLDWEKGVVAVDSNSGASGYQKMVSLAAAASCSVVALINQAEVASYSLQAFW